MSTHLSSLKYCTSAVRAHTHTIVIYEIKSSKQPHKVWNFWIFQYGGTAMVEQCNHSISHLISHLSSRLQWNVMIHRVASQFSRSFWKELTCQIKFGAWNCWLCVRALACILRLWGCEWNHDFRICWNCHG